MTVKTGRYFHCVQSCKTPHKHFHFQKGDKLSSRKQKHPFWCTSSQRSETLRVVGSRQFEKVNFYYSSVLKLFDLDNSYKYVLLIVICGGKWVHYSNRSAILRTEHSITRIPKKTENLVSINPIRDALQVDKGHLVKLTPTEIKSLHLFQNGERRTRTL